MIMMRNKPSDVRSHFGSSHLGCLAPWGLGRASAIAVGAQTPYGWRAACNSAGVRVNLETLGFRAAIGVGGSLCSLLWRPASVVEGGTYSESTFLGENDCRYVHRWVWPGAAGFHAVSESSV